MCWEEHSSTSSKSFMSGWYKLSIKFTTALKEVVQGGSIAKISLGKTTIVSEEQADSSMPLPLSTILTIENNFFSLLLLVNSDMRSKIAKG